MSSYFEFQKLVKFCEIFKIHIIHWNQIATTKVITPTITTTTTTTDTRATAKQQQPHTLPCRQSHRQHRYDARAAHCSCIAARLTAYTQISSFSALCLTIAAGTLDRAFSG